MKRLLIAALFVSPSVFAAYTTMTIEGVKQSNGVWTTAGVMDTQGFVRTTGAVTVHGATRNLPVTMAVDTLPLGSVVKGAVRAAGPIAVAAAAYDIYEFLEQNGIGADGNEWVLPDPDKDPLTIYDSYVSPDCSTAISANPAGSVAQLWANDVNYKKYLSGHPDWSVSCYAMGTGTRCDLKYKGTYLQKSAVLKYCTCSDQQVSSCQPLQSVPEFKWDSLPALTVPLLSSGLGNLPSLAGYPKPIKSTDFEPFSEWLGAPYFKDGQWWRDRMDVSPSPAPGQPTRVRVDIGPVKLEGQTDPTVKPDDTPASENTQPKEQSKFCDDNPGSIACQEMGNPEEVEPIEPDEKQFQLDTNQSWGASNGACPASPSVTLFTGKVITFDYQPTCDFLALLRPIIIAFALMTAIFIALGRTD